MFLTSLYQISDSRLHLRTVFQKYDMINNLELSMKACGFSPSVSVTARFSLSSYSEFIYQYLWHLFFSLSPLSWERIGQHGEAKAPVKWLYHGETRAGRGPRLKAEWQAAETIKIELLSLAARALLIQTGVQAALIHTHSHTHLLSCGT